MIMQTMMIICHIFKLNFISNVERYNMDMKGRENEKNTLYLYIIMQNYDFE